MTTNANGSDSRSCVFNILLINYKRIYDNSLASTQSDGSRIILCSQSENDKKIMFKYINLESIQNEIFSTRNNL